MYYLKTQTFGCSVYSFLLLFYHGAYFPFFPIWLHDINHISKVIRVLFCRYFSVLAIIPTAVWSAF